MSSEAPTLAELKRAVADSKKIDPTLYTSQCLALHVKPNSRIVERGEALFHDKERVDLSSNYIGGAGFQAMVDALAKNEKLETLVVTNNGLTNTAVVFFCKAFAAHPKLRVVDFSGNPISLPAGLALIDLVHRNPRIEEVHLAETHIGDAVLRRLRRCLNLNVKAAPRNNKSQPPGRVSREGEGKSQVEASTPLGVTPFQRAKAEHERKTAARREAAGQAVADRERRCTEDIAEWFAAHPNLKGVDRRTDGWAVINICVDSTPYDFKSELNVIQKTIIPQLNQKFLQRKLHFVYNAMYSDVPSDYFESDKVPVQRRSAVVDEHRRWLEVCSPFIIHLIGDRIGMMEHITPAQADRSHTQAIQQLNYDYGVTLNQGCSIAMLRQSAQQLGLPVSLLPIMSDQPSVAYPDANATMVKVAVAEAQGVRHKLADFNFPLLEQRWKNHVEFRRRVALQHAPCFVVQNYDAQYDGIDEAGSVRLAELEGFTHALTKRLLAMVNHLYPATRQPNRLLPVPLTRLEGAWIGQSADIPVGKRHLVGKLELYTVTPPSRNIALVYGASGTGNTTVLRAYVKRNVVKPTYVLASHFCRQPTLYEEPTDPRTVFLSLIRQLSPDKQVPGFIAAEVDVVKVKEAFMQLLARTSHELPDGQLIVLVIDALDAIDNLVLPCEALRLGDTGQDAWNPPPTVGTIQPRPPKSTTIRDRFDWIPVCLSRNVRIIASSTTNSAAHTVLGQRGHDSCEPIFTGEMGENDIETLVLQEATLTNWDATDEQINILRAKVDSRNPEYLKLAFSALRKAAGTPQYLSSTAFLQQLPHTTEELCLQILRSLEATVGIPLAKLAVSLLLVSRWGLLEMELRELLAKYTPLPPPAPSTTSQPAVALRRLLNAELFESIFHALAPVLQPPVSDAAPAEFRTVGPCGLNGMDRLLYIDSRAFRRIASRRYLTEEGEAVVNDAPTTTPQALAAECTPEPSLVEVHHHALAHYYRRIAQLEDHPLRARALKEMPYHLQESAMWTTFEQSVVCLDFLALTYAFGLGYSVLRELTRAYNRMDAQHDPTIAMQALKLKLKEYIYFVRDNNSNLVLYPHMVRQIAITCGTDTHVHKDANDYFQAQQHLPHFAVVNKTKGKLHRERITDCHFAPSGLRFATCSDDRAVRICTLNGETLISINQSASRLQLLAYSRSSRYISVAAEDHSLMTFDATNGVLVSKCSGHSAPITSIALSARGRFVVSGSEDRTMKVWESEVGALVCSVSHVPFAHHTCAFGGVGSVQTHPLEEDKFYSTCDRRFLGWKLAQSRDGCDQTLCIVAHASLPLAGFHLIHDGHFVVTTCKELTAPTSGTLRNEDNVKVWSLQTGRCVASMNMGLPGTSLQPGPVASAVSPSETCLATALGDGSIQLHHLDPRNFAPEGEEPMIVTPYRHFPAYAGHPTPKILAMRFSYDSTYLCATGNVRQLKVWRTTDLEPPKVAAQEGSASERADSPSAHEAAAASMEVQRLKPVAEFLMDQPTTCIDWTTNPVEDGAELIVGDSVGRLRALRLKHAGVETD